MIPIHTNQKQFEAHCEELGTAAYSGCLRVGADGRVADGDRTVEGE